MKGCTTAGVFFCELLFWSMGKEDAMIRVNGEEKMLEEETSLLEFLGQERYQTARIAVEKNGEIVPKSRYVETLLRDGDALEIVSFVGGG